MSTTFQVADMTIHRIVEQEGPMLPADYLFPNLAPEMLAENRSWLEPWALNAENVFILAMQSYVVRTPQFTFLIDSCIGNDKDRPGRPAWDRKSDGVYMAGLAAAGIVPEQIDFVMCTHLHVDHVGWNTKLVDGKWVPTFPNARYVFAKTEYGYWEAEHAKAANPVFADSVLPIIEARKGLLVNSDFALGDHVRLLPTPGHTPGHVSIALGRTGKEAVVTGDIIHSPLQLRYPELSAGFDVDPVQSAVTRRAFFERYCDTDTLCCTIHFPSPSSGKIKRWGDGFKCEMVGA